MHSDRPATIVLKGATCRVWMLLYAARNYTSKYIRSGARIMARIRKQAGRGASFVVARTRRVARHALRRASSRRVKLARHASRRSASMARKLGRRLEKTSARFSGCPGCGGRSHEWLAIKMAKPRSTIVPRRTWAVGCRACGLVFTTPRPSAGDLASYYAPQGDWMQRKQSQHPAERAHIGRPLWNVVAAELNLQNGHGRRVLDVGCGNGNWLNMLANHGWQTFGLEPSSRAAFARHREVTEIPRDRSFDLVILHHVLEHVAEPGRMLRSASAALRDDGALIISVPNFDAVAIHRDFHYCINGRHHLQAFTADCLRVLLTHAGFTHVSVIDDRQVRPLKLRLVARRNGAPATGRVSEPLHAARGLLRSIGMMDGGSN